MTLTKELAAVSVVIPCYKCARTIERAIASVVAQTWRPAEVILVDDASGDDTRALLQKLKAQFCPGWIKLVFLDSNVGAGSARNAGWAVASQPYVAFLDADNAWHSRKIEIQYGFMAAHPDVALCGHKYKVLQQDVLLCWPVEERNAEPVSKFIMLLSNRFSTSSVMIRRDSEDRFLTGQRYIEDYMLWLKIICSGKKVMIFPQELVAFYKGLYGVAGLSARLWLMERSELGNYRRLYVSGFINGLQLVVLVAFSLLKYVRRLVIYAGYLRWKK